MVLHGSEFTMREIQHDDYRLQLLEFVRRHHCLDVAQLPFEESQRSDPQRLIRPLQKPIVHTNGPPFEFSLRVRGGLRWLGWLFRERSEKFDHPFAQGIADQEI